MSMNELLELAEGVGENGEYEAFGDSSEGSLEEFKRLQEKAFKLYKQQRMSLIGGGSHNNPGLIGGTMSNAMPLSGNHYMS